MPHAQAYVVAHRAKAPHYHVLAFTQALTQRPSRFEEAPMEILNLARVVVNTYAEEHVEEEYVPPFEDTPPFGSMYVAPPTLLASPEIGQETVHDRVGGYARILGSQRHIRG